MNALQHARSERLETRLEESPPLESPADRYRRDGYYIARQLVPGPVVERTFADMHRLATQQLTRLGLAPSRGNGAEAVHDDLKRLFAADLKAYIATLTLCAKLVSLYELYIHPQIRSFTESLGLAFPVLQTAPVMHVMSRSLKIPGGYQGIGVHQDWPTLQGSLDTVTVWIPFVEVDRNRFTLEIIPGTHTAGLYPSTRREHFFEVDPDCYDVERFVPVEGVPGDIVFMSSFAIHRSSMTGDDRLRVATSLRYENAAEPHFIDRSYPFAQKRSVVRELITADFPTAEQLRHIYRDPSRIQARGAERTP